MESGHPLLADFEYTIKRLSALDVMSKNRTEPIHIPMKKQASIVIISFGGLQPVARHVKKVKVHTEAIINAK